MKRKCSACNGRGYLLADNDVHGLRIERCDACVPNATDEMAVIHVHKLANISEQLYKALVHLVQFIELDPDYEVGDDDGTQDRLLERAHQALAAYRQATKKPRKKHA